MAFEQEILELTNLALVFLKEGKKEEAAAKIDEALLKCSRASYEAAKEAIFELNRQLAKQKRILREIRKRIETFPEPLCFDIAHLLNPLLKNIENEIANLTAKKRRLSRPEQR
uniref:Uncharacterized protein n=1 Tax=candidate division CPR3 bacterium TaxID=2268181 RepID=A0A7V3J9L3_UNCC3